MRAGSWTFPVQAQLEHLLRVQRCPTIASVAFYGPHATQGERPKESVEPCPRELTGGNSPHTTNQPRKMKTDRVPLKYFFSTARGCPQQSQLVDARTVSRNQVHRENRFSCSGTPVPDFRAMRRSRSSIRWIRCRIATTEWPLRRASSGQEMPSILN